MSGGRSGSGRNDTLVAIQRAMLSSAASIVVPIGKGGGIERHRIAFRDA